MKLYYAPMEGLTGHIYRNAHHAFFNNIDKYFSPFIVANQSNSLKTREINDVLPEHNQDIILIPQILTNDAINFNNTAKRIKELGYNEINLNLGCPARTVVSKGKGSGFLAKRDELDVFLDKIYSGTNTKISIKTRIGKDNPDEFYELINIFNKYPIEELIIHPRIQKDFYNNKPNLTIFKDALTLSKNPVCYNGDIFTSEDYKRFILDFPDVEAVMCGRGLLANPSLADEITNHSKIKKDLLKEFHDRLYNDYKARLCGDTNLLYKMKELWFYMGAVFTDNTKYMKKIKKCNYLSEYDQVVSSLFLEQDILKTWESFSFL